jgi:hypothetical protein
MFATKMTARLRATLAVVALSGALGLCAPAQAAKLGPYFPMPNGFSLTGIARDSLLSIQASWLNNGLDNLNKAKKDAEAALEKAKADAPDQVGAQEEKVKALDKLIDETKAEIALSTNTDASNEVQKERKSKLLLNLNQWINELNHMATEQMKIAIMKDGAEAMAAQNRNYQLSEQADNLEKAKRDPSIEDWATKH